MAEKRDRDLRGEFAERLHEHQRIVGKVCSVYAVGPEDREDLFQEIVTQLWRAYPSFRAESSFATWAFRVALNTALLGRRGAAAQRRSAVPLGEEALHGVAATCGRDSAEVKEGAQLLHECVQGLRAVDRALVLLHLEGRAHGEIAEILGLSTGNVGVRLHRIKATLRECLIARGYVEEPTP